MQKNKKQSLSSLKDKDITKKRPKDDDSGNAVG